jgi:hypothetical protein
MVGSCEHGNETSGSMTVGDCLINGGATELIKADWMLSDAISWQLCETLVSTFNRFRLTSRLRNVH